MSKRIFLDEQGKVCSDGSQCLMAQGTATRAAAETAAELAQHVITCGTDQAIALGALRADRPQSGPGHHQCEVERPPRRDNALAGVHRLSPGSPRKSWLFAGSERGADRAAAMTTLIMTAKLNDVDPQAWLADVLGQIADIPQGRLAELLPWNWKQPNLRAAA